VNAIEVVALCGAGVAIALLLALVWALDYIRANVPYSSARRSARVELPADIDVPTATRLKAGLFS
jgi:hypothetical protein